MNNKNQLFQLFGSPKANQPGIQNEPVNGMFNNMNEFFDELQKFKQTLNRTPEETLQNLLNSGGMSQQQYNMLYGLAKKIQKSM